MWNAFIILMVLWILLKFVLGKGGYIHMIVVAAISIAVVQLIAERKNRYHKASDN
jgi:O-antigen ligase